jgi:hypothetical protein
LQDGVESSLSPDDLLQRAPDLTLLLDATGGARVKGPAGDVVVGPAAVELLLALTRVCTLRELLARATATGAQSWMDVTSALLLLRRAGAVVRAGDRWPAPSARAPFDTQTEQALMLQDRTRTEAFRRAVAEVVRPGDVVVDVGTGTGVLALAAAQAGARRVYAVEVGAIADVAEALFEANGVSDRVTLVRGWSTDVDLPERVDVVVSETIGSEPLAERVLELFRDVRTRWAHPQTRWVPQRLTVAGHACQLPATWSGSFTPERVAEWSSWYGADMTPLLRWQGQQNPHLVSREDVSSWTALTQSVVLADLDLTAVGVLKVDAAAAANVLRAGRVDALVTWFAAELSPSVTLSLDPALGGSSSWLHSVNWVPPRQLAVGDEVVLRYRYRAGRPNGLSLGP